MPTLEEIASTIEEPQETTDPVISKAKFKLLKKNLMEIEGLNWEKVKDWHYVGGFKHPDRDSGMPCKRTQNLEKLFKGYFPDTGDRWLANLKVMEAREKCYCETPIYWQYIIVKDLNVFKVMPNVYYAKKRDRDFALVGCECIKRFLNISLSKTCVNCNAKHRNSSTELCNDCRTDGKYGLFFCDFCDKKQETKLKLVDNKRKCSECHEKWLKYCEYCKVETDTVCKINRNNGKRRCGDCYDRHLNYALKKSMETNYGYSHQSYH